MTQVSGIRIAPHGIYDCKGRGSIVLVKMAVNVDPQQSTLASECRSASSMSARIARTTMIRRAVKCRLKMARGALKQTIPETLFELLDRCGRNGATCRDPRLRR